MTASSTGPKRFSLGGLSLTLPSRQPSSAPPANAPTSPSFLNGPSSLRSPSSEHLLGPPISSPTPRTTSSSASVPLAPASDAQTAGSIVVQREELYRQLRALDTLLQLLATYHALAGSIAKTEQKLAKACADILPVGSDAAGGAHPTGSAEVVSNALGSTGELFHLLGAVSTKHAKSIGAVLGPLQEALVKHSKKVAKLARTLETSLAEREAKVRKSAGGLERSLGRAGGGAGSGTGWMGGGGGGGGGGAAGKEERLLGTLRALGEEINNSKEAHLIQTSHLQTAALLQTAAAISAVGASQFTASTEAVRRMAPAVGEVLRWKALADASWTGSAGVGGLALPDGLIAGDETEPAFAGGLAEDQRRMSALVDGLAPDNDESRLRPPVRPYAAASVAGSPTSSPRFQAGSLPSQSPARPAALPLPPTSTTAFRQLPTAPSPGSRDHAPAESPVERHYRLPSPALDNGSLSSRRDIGSAPKKVAYVEQAEIIPDDRQRDPDISAARQSLDSRDDALESDYNRLADERRRFEGYERERAAFDAEETARERTYEDAALQRQLEEDKEAFRRVLEREADEAVADRQREEARREELDRERLARAQRAEREAAEKARERDEAAAAEAVEEARVRAIRDRFEEFRRQSDRRPSASPPAQSSPPSGGAALGRRVSQLSARFEEISQTGSADSTTRGSGGNGPQPVGPRRLARTSTASFDPAANTRPLKVVAPPANHRRTTYPLATAAYPTHSPSAPSDSGSFGSMINGGGRLLREEVFDDGLHSGGAPREDDSRGWATLAREDSVREGELRFREPAGSFQARPAGDGGRGGGGWR